MWYLVTKLLFFWGHRNARDADLLQLLVVGLRAVFHTSGPSMAPATCFHTSLVGSSCACVVPVSQSADDGFVDLCHKFMCRRVRMCNMFGVPQDTHDIVRIA